MSQMPEPSVAWPPEFYGPLLASSPRYRFLGHNPGYRAVRRVLPRYLRPGLRALDIGSGVGIGAAHLAAAGAERVTYTGIDPDPEACALARRVLAALPAARVRGQIHEQPIADYLAGDPRPADLVLWNYAFHECVDLGRPESLGPFAGRVAALLAPAGLLVVGDPFFAPGASEEEKARTYAYVARITGHDDRGRFLPAGLIARLFTEAGLALRESHDRPNVFLAPYLGLSHARYALLVFERPA